MTFESTSSSGDNPPTPSLRDSGAALLREGRFSEAATMLTDAVEMDPQDEGAWRLLGGALASTGNYERAVPAFERAINLAPDNARNYYNVALAYQATQRAGDAQAAAAKSVSLDSTYQPAQMLLQTLGGMPAPAPVAPIASAPPTAASLSMGSGIPSPITPIPSPAAPPTGPLPSAPSGPPTAMPGLGAIGGGMSGLGAIGGGPAPTAPPVAPPSGGMGGAPGGLSSVGGGTPYGSPPGAPAGPPPPYTPVQGGYAPPQGGYAPQQGGFTPPPGGYAPPQGYAPQPQLGYGGGMGGPDVKASEILTMAIVGFVCFGFILGPVAWVRANKALQTLDQYPGADQSKRGTLTTARVIAIIVTVLSVIGTIARIAMIFAGSSSSSH